MSDDFVAEVQWPPAEYLSKKSPHSARSWRQEVLGEILPTHNLTGDCPTAEDAWREAVATIDEMTREVSDE